MRFTVVDSYLQSLRVAGSLHRPDLPAFGRMAVASRVMTPTN